MKKVIRWVCMLGMGLGCGGCVSQSTYLKQVKTADQLTTEKAMLEKEKAALTNQLLTVEQRRLALEENLTASKKENAGLFSSLNAKSGELNKRVSDLSYEKQELAQQLRETQHRIQRRPELMAHLRQEFGLRSIGIFSGRSRVVGQNCSVSLSLARLRQTRACC